MLKGLEVHALSKGPFRLGQTEQSIGSPREAGASQSSRASCTVDQTVGLTCIKVTVSFRRSGCETAKMLSTEE